MSRLPRVSGKQALAALRRGGFSLDHVNGSHHVLIGPAGQRVVVPVHAGENVPTGTMQNVLRQAGLSTDEFARLLGHKREARSTGQAEKPGVKDNRSVSSDAPGLGRPDGGTAALGRATTPGHSGAPTRSRRRRAR